MTKSLSIKVISEACGILPQTLRAWEKRYNTFSPERNATGQRLYSQIDLKRAIAIANLIKRGFTISEVSNHNYEALEELLEKTYVKNKTTLNDRALKGGNDVKYLVELVREFKFEKFVEEIFRQKTILGAKEFVFDVSIPLLKQAGEDVEKGHLLVTHEHIISTIIRGQLSELKVSINMLSKLKTSFHRYALATPEDNFHELPIIIADLICGLNLKHSVYLGPAHPAESLAISVDALKCDRVILGTIDSKKWSYEKEMIPYLYRMDSKLKQSVEVIIGGGWNMDFPKFKNIKKVHYIESFEILYHKFAQSIL